MVIRPSGMTNNLLSKCSATVPESEQLAQEVDAASLRNIGLDALRCIAVWLVLFRHLPIPSKATGFFAESLRVLHRGGWIGVDLFFVLSGFLVSGLLFREFQRTGSASIKRFLIRRGFKIYPPFWVLIGATVVMRCWFEKTGIQWSNLVGELLFLQNYYDCLWGHTWSLAVEEHFYFIYHFAGENPPLICGSKSPTPRRFVSYQFWSSEQAF